MAKAAKRKVARKVRKVARKRARTTRKVARKVRKAVGKRAKATKKAVKKVVRSVPAQPSRERIAPVVRASVVMPVAMPTHSPIRPEELRPMPLFDRDMPAHDDD
jgi:hypothetical protein